jgi:hypothetical protein
VTATGVGEIRVDLRTGDLLLFSGKGMASAGIKRILGCAWSHVGLVVRSAAGDLPLLLESTPCRDLVDVVTGRATGGVRLVSLSERLATFEGALALRRLNRPLAAAQLDRLAGVLRELHGRPYERRLLELFLAVSDRIDLNRENLKSLFCSELIAEILQRIGLLDDIGHGGRPSNEYTPRHFGGAYDLKLRQGFAFGPEIRLDRLAMSSEIRAAA